MLLLRPHRKIQHLKFAKEHLDDAFREQVPWTDQGLIQLLINGHKFQEPLSHCSVSGGGSIVL